MPHQIDLEQFLDQLASLRGKGTPDVTSREPTAHVSYRPPAPCSRDLKREIYDLLYQASGGWLTRRQIADALKLKKTDHVFEKCEALVEDGHIEKGYTQYRPNVLMVWYRVK